jgi:4'-phosphopantetheinyl transferase
MSSEELKWCRTVPRKLIYSNEVHVWRVFLDLTSVQIDYLQKILSADELTRVSRFHFEKDQKRFIAARGILRKILGHYLDKNPHDIRFEYTRHGKPMLASESGFDTIGFNLSHSDEFVLYAVTLDQNIGIDIERIRDDVDMDQISQRFFSQGEISSLKQIQKNKCSEVFFQYWTRKEAFLKAMGEGISFPMAQCDVSLINEMGLSPVILSGNNEDNSCWYVQDLFPYRGYAAALAVEKSGSDILYWHYAL